MARNGRLILCALLALLGLASAAGWLFDIGILTSVIPDMPTMKFNTALCFIAASISFAAAGAASERRGALLMPAAIFLAVVPGLTLVEYLSGASLGIDELIVADQGFQRPGSVPGRMSPLTAIAFIALSGAALLIGLGRRTKSIATGHYLSVIAGFVAFLSAAGYAFGAEAFRGIGAYTAIAVHTAVGLMVGSAAGLATRADEGWLAGFGDAPAARAVVLKLLPLALFVPFLFGLLLLLGTGLGFYNAAFGFALFVPAMAVGLTLIALVLGNSTRASELALYRSSAALQLSEARYRRIFEQTSDIILTADLDQVIDGCNSSAARAVGLTPDHVIGRRIADFLSPDDFERTSSMLRQKLEQGGTTRYDVQVRSASGDLLQWEVNSGLTFDENGTPVGLHVVARDNTERKRAEEHQQLLINELNHRVKNTLAVVQSISEQTMRGGAVDPQVRNALSGRLAALAAAHDVVTREMWTSAPMGEIVGGALRPFCSDNRCTLEGPDVALAPKTAVSLGLAVHELATNASKYGALSNERGRVVVRWSVSDGKLEFV